MKLTDILALVLVAAIWGVNFIVVAIGLKYLPPFSLNVLRFILVVLPAISFVKRPKVPLPKLILYGVVMFAAQFAFLFSAIHLGLSAGLTALVMQSNAFFTIAFAALILKERPLPVQLLGIAVAGCGILTVGMHTGGGVTVGGLLCALLAAMCWGAGGVLTKTFGNVEMLGVVVWGSLFALILLLPLGLIVEGEQLKQVQFGNLHWPLLAAVGYNAYISVFIGYTVWSRVLSRHSTAAVAPFTFLVPVFAFLSSAIFLHEEFTLWKLEATALILLGLSLNQYGTKILNRWGREPKFVPPPD